MNRQTELNGIISIILILLISLGGCWSYRLGQKNIEDKISNTIHTQKVDSVKLMQGKLDSILEIKAISDIKSKKRIDSLQTYLKVKQGQIFTLNNHVSELAERIKNLTGAEKLTMIDSLVAKDTVYAIKCILEAPAKDSTINIQCDIIKLQKQMIDQDNIDGTIDNLALQKCLDANKSKAGLIDFDESKLPKHPKWNNFVKAIQKPFVWAVSSVAIVEGAIIYFTK